MLIHIVVKDKNNYNPAFDENIANIKKRIPHYKILMWDDASFEEFIKKKCGLSYMCFKRLNKKIGAMVADYIRYNVLYYCGGVYIDIKSTLKHDWDDFMDIYEPDRLHIFEWDCKNYYEFINWFIVCNKGNIILKDLIITINNAIIKYDTDTKNKLARYKTTKQKVLHFTGPRMLTRICKEALGVKEATDLILVHNNAERKKNLQYNIYKNNYKKYYRQPHYSSVAEPLCI